MVPPRGLNEQKRRAIVEAAIAEFSEQGFAATSMDRVAARAEVSKRTVYNHFPGKDELFQAITLEMWERVIKATELAYDPGESLAHQLGYIAEREIDAVCSPDFIALARVTLVEYTRSPEMARQAFEQFDHREKGLVRWVREATEDGQLKVRDCSFAAHQFLALIKSFAFWPQIFAGQPAPDEVMRKHIIDSAVSMFLDHYAT